MPQREDRSAHDAAQAGGDARRYGPTLVPVLLAPGVDPLEGFTPEEAGPSHDPLDAFRPEPDARFRDLPTQPAPEAAGIAPVESGAWQEPAPHRRGHFPAVAGISLLALAMMGVTAFLLVNDPTAETGAPPTANSPAPNPAATAPPPDLDPPVAAVHGEKDRAASPRLPAPAPLPSGGQAVPSRREEGPSRGTSNRGQLVIASEPSGARVFLDGRPAGITPLRLSNIAAARHELSVVQGSIAVNRSVDVAAGATANVFVSLADGAGEATLGAPGLLNVQSAVPLRIVESGRTLGVSGEAAVSVAPGRHELELVNDEVELRVPLTVEIVTGKPTHLSVPLPTGTLSVNAEPWAEVFVDGRSVGITPIANAPVPVGRHDLAWRHPQLGEKRSTIVVGAQTPARASMDLNR